MKEEIQESTERAFQAYGRPLAKFTLFKYLGQVLTVADDNWPEVIGNLQKELKIWARLARILIREGAMPRGLEMLFNAVVQVVLLFGSETWVLTPRMGRYLGNFQNRVARRITERKSKRQEDRGW